MDALRTNADEWPRWIADLRRLLPIRSQFVLSGNIRDVFLTPQAGQDGQRAPLPLLDCLWAALRLEGYQWMAVYDRVDGVQIFPRVTEVQQRAAKVLCQTIRDGRIEISLARLPDLLQAFAVNSNERAAFVIDYASRIPVNLNSLTEAEHEFFVRCEKLSRTARQLLPPAVEGAVRPMTPYFNPVIWIAHKENDLPAWYSIENDLVESLVISKPNFDSRRTSAELLLQQSSSSSLPPERRAQIAGVFATQTEGMTIRAMVSITQLGRAQGITADNITDAVRLYKVGLPENKWKAEYLKDRIRTAYATLGNRVKGQPQAINKTVDILTRSVVGLTGAQSASTNAGRPRGVLFFAGPTGVGKTELAKSLTELLFSDERAYIRFDMSEFSAEHADLRLIGAPPSYIGFEAGGELTNAIRERPFSVVLFDEIEKAHPRILDKFLQVLEDGRLTDGRGQTVYFSEALLIFTSNLGIFTDETDGEHFVRRQAVAPGQPYETVEAEIKKGIERHFKYVLNRPELLNRFGDNIVVFNFISPEIGSQILEGMVGNILDRVAKEQKISVSVDGRALGQLRQICLADMANGGRGIGNRLETAFINPLARALFSANTAEGSQLTVREIRSENGVYEVILS